MELTASRKANYDLLPLFREVLTDKDLEIYKDYPPEHAFRWITSLKRIDWDKYFTHRRPVHELAQLAASSIPNNPIGFLRPEWVDRPLQKYKPYCPLWLREQAVKFEEATKRQHFVDMKIIYHQIKLSVDI